ncbi:hypothetical protein BH09BAC4_BH09BAC4_26640 [soil metagenome]
MKHRIGTIFCLLIATLPFFACEKKADPPASVSFETTHTTSNEILDPAPMLKQRITGIGQSTQLGISKFVAVSVMNMTTAPPFQITGPATFYADNGDTFTTTFTGTATPNADGSLTLELNNTITGGTGKFLHATGSLISKSIVGPKIPTPTITGKGTITY